MIDEASSTAGRLGLGLLADQAAALAATLGETVARLPTAVVLRRASRGWVVEVDGRSGHLAATRGLAQLARLLGQPHTEVHALDLIAGGPTAPAADGAPLLDAAAKQAYRARLSDLRKDLDEAQGRRDPERAARAQMEIDALSGELSRALGLGGRDRRLGSDAERARVNVTRTLRAAIRRIGDVAPALGADLDRSVLTGTFCGYAPRPGERPLQWRVEGRAGRP